MGRVAGEAHQVPQVTFLLGYSAGSKGTDSPGSQLDLSLLVAHPSEAAQHWDLQVQVTQPLPVRESGPLLAAEWKSEQKPACRL